MKKSGKYIIFFIVAVFIAYCAYLATSEYLKGEANKNASTNSLNETQSKSGTINNTVKENTIENKVNDVSENNIAKEPVKEVKEEQKENNQEQVKTPEQTKVKDEATKPVIENSEISDVSDEQKAIDIVKKDWGSTSGVTFKARLKQNGEYEVAVRDINTSSAFAFYTVNPKTGEFSY